MKTIRCDSSRNTLVFVTALILCLAFSTGTSQAQWTKVNLDSTVQYNQIIFTDSLHGYIAASSLQSTDTSGAILFITRDGGRTWKEDKLDTWELLSVSAIGDSLVWAGGSGGKIYYSHDGGNTWQIDTIVVNRISVGVETLQFVDSLNGWIAGEYDFSGYGVGIFHSTNGGAIWKPQYTYSYDYSSGLGNGCFTDKLHGWFGIYYNILRTTNGGKTWVQEAVPVSAGDYMKSVYFIDTLRGWAIGTMSIYRTTDGGMKWIESPGDTIFAPPNIGTLISVFFADTSTGWVGDGYGRIYRTTDGGLSWQRSDSSGHGINSIFFLNKNNGWAVGYKTVLHTTNGGVTAIDNTSPSPTAFRLFQNYPNPFNPSTSIQYAIGNPANGTSTQFVTLKVYDILGREVKSLVNEYKEPGRYSVSLDASKLSSGVYFYTLRAGNYIVTKKMMLLK